VTILQKFGGSPHTDESGGASQATSKEVRVIMVHGTWALGLPFKKPYQPDAPRWFEKG
jgi:hypothetical protein